MHRPRSYDRRAFLRLAGATAAMVACSAAAPPSPAPSVETAAATASPTPSPIPRTVNVYSALDDPTTAALLADFRSHVPHVDTILLPLAVASELQARIETERGRPKADVFLGGSSEFHDALAQEGLLEPYSAPAAKDIDGRFKDAGGSWTGWYTGILGFGSNPDRLKEVGGKKPASWDDLLDPIWKAKLALPDPAKTAGGYLFLATQVFRFDRDEGKAIDFMKRLHANVAEYGPTEPATLALIEQGRYIGCVGWAHDILTDKAKNRPIDLSVPSDTGFEVGAVSIIKGAASLGLAKDLVDWAVSKEAGDLGVRLSLRASTRGDVAPPSGAPKLADLKLVSYDRQWASDNRERLQRLWQTRVGP